MMITKIASVFASEFILRLVDWPFLLFVFLVVFVLMFRKQLQKLFARGDITISWGKNRSVRLRELGENIGQELDPLIERLDALEDQVESLARVDEGKGREPSTGALEEAALEGLETRVLEALEDPRYEWRSLERLAVVSGSTEENVRKVLRTKPDVVFGSTRAGEPLVKLTDE